MAHRRAATQRSSVAATILRALGAIKLSDGYQYVCVLCDFFGVAQTRAPDFEAPKPDEREYNPNSRNAPKI